MKKTGIIKGENFNKIIFYQFKMEEDFNKIFIRNFQKGKSFIRQLLNAYYEKQPEKAALLWKNFKTEVEKRSKTEVLNELKEEAMLDAKERIRIVASNWEFILNEFLKVFPPECVLMLLVSNNMEEILNDVADSFFTEIKSLSKTLSSEIKELQYQEYHEYYKKIRKTFAKIMNNEINFDEFILASPCDSFCDAKHIGEVKVDFLSMNRLRRLIKNLDLENRILKKFDLKMVNSCVNNPMVITRNVLLTIILRYSAIAKVTNKKPINLDISKIDVSTITYCDIRNQIDKLDLPEEEIDYLYDIVNHLEEMKIPLEIYF